MTSTMTGVNNGAPGTATPAKPRRRGNKRLPDEFSTLQVRWALLEYLGVVLSDERLRQFREGYQERRQRKAGFTYAKAHEARLTQGKHWYTAPGKPTIVYTLAGLRKLFELHCYRLDDDEIQETASQPRTRWEQKRLESQRQELAPESSPGPNPQPNQNSA